ncbi:MAG: ABC transporter permease [Nitrospirota bacterium]
MDFLINSIIKALELIVSLDPELTGIVVLSFKVSGFAIIISTIIALVITLVLDLKNFAGKNIIVTLINTLMGLPPVVAGLMLYLIFSRSGLLGFMSILYTPAAMVVAQIVLATPIIAALSYAAVVSADPGLKFTALTLGAAPCQATIKVMKNVRYSILASVLAGLGRVMAEVGAVLIVGGNIAGFTRVMTTAIALEADKGDFELAIALGMILLCIAFVLNAALFHFQKKGVQR